MGFSLMLRGAEKLVPLPNTGALTVVTTNEKSTIWGNVDLHLSTKITKSLIEIHLNKYELEFLKQTVHIACVHILLFEIWFAFFIAKTLVWNNNFVRKAV